MSHLCSYIDASDVAPMGGECELACIYMYIYILTLFGAARRVRALDLSAPYFEHIKP